MTSNLTPADAMAGAAMPPRTVVSIRPFIHKEVADGDPD